MVFNIAILRYCGIPAALCHFAEKRAVPCRSAPAVRFVWLPVLLFSLMAFVAAPPAAAQVAEGFGLPGFSAGAAITERATADNTGKLTGKERFLRGNRRSNAFVGRDKTSRATFVGEQQGAASGRVRAATEDLRLRYQRSANLASQRTNSVDTGINEPQLAIGFTGQKADPTAIEAQASARLKELAQSGRFPLVSVSVDARQATLRGVVASPEDRLLLGSLVRMEPGLSEVVNLLEVR
jgi:hypothetical protein